MLENGKIKRSSLYLQSLYIILGILLVYLVHSGLFNDVAEGSIGFYIQLILVTFPLGLISLLIVTVAKGFASGNSVGAVLLTTLMFGLGYFQWFYLVPRIFYRSTIYKKVSNVHAYGKIRAASLLLTLLFLIILICNALINLIGAL